MYFDALTLAAVAEELNDTLLGGRIQRALLPNQQSVALEIYNHGRRHHLLLSAHPQFTRVHLSAAKLSRGVERDTPILLLLRKYVVGGRILAIEQPELERVLVLSIVKGAQPRNTTALDDPADDEPDDLDAPETADDVPIGAAPRRSELIIETMERRGNVILVGDDNIILESLRHVTPRMSHRAVQPREPYELPPRQEKRDPRQATPEGMRALQAGPETNLARAIVAAYRAMSPQAAREVAFRAVGDIAAKVGADLPWAKLALAVRGLWNDDWQPCIVRNGAEPQAYAPYLITHMPRAEPCTSISAALEVFYEAHERLTAHQQRRDAVRRQILETRERLDFQRRGLSSELKRADDLDRLRWEGEMIYAFMHTLAAGQTQLDVEGRAIILDPTRTTVENAQDRFRSYDKAKGALAGVPERLQTVETRLAGIDETLALLDLAEGFEQIEGIAREAEEQGFIRATSGRAAPKTRRQPPLRVDSSDGYAIYVGRSAGQNEQVTFKLGAGDDMWLHARGLPGAHVIIKSAGREVPDATLQEAAALAAYFSQARGEAAVEIDISRRSLVRRIPNAPAGLVTYRAERTIRAAPRMPD